MKRSKRRKAAGRGLRLAAVLAAVKSAAAAAPVSPRAPIEYRCDRMQLTRAQHGGVCQGNVVLRQNELLVCCERLVGQADANGQWQSFVCEGNVRCQQHDVRLWAGRAQYSAQKQRLRLTREPVAERVGSVLRGDTITFYTQDDSLEVAAPRGQLVTQAPAAGAPGLEGPTLPAQCPLPAAASQAP